MNLVRRILGSSLGKKYLMAVTGLGMFVFTVGHLLGNLQIFLGAEAVNSYAAFLKSKPGLLWGARLGLIAILGIHLWAAFSLILANRAARPQGYADYTAKDASLASRTMAVTGVVILAFVIYHLLHYTAQIPAVNLTGKDFGALQDAKGRHDVYGMMILGFSNPVVSIFYLVAVSLLSVHLSHGLAAMFQSLGIKHRAYALLIDRAALLAAGVLLVGYASIPLAVMTKLVK